MPLYLAPYRGDGLTTETSFVPVASEQPGAAWTDLRPDVTRLDGGGLGKCFLWLPVADANPQLDQIADTKVESLKQGTKNRLISSLGLAKLDAIRIDDALFELMTVPPTNRWKPLVAGVDGKLELYLGGLIKRTSAISGGTTLTESFDTADSDTLGPVQTWVEDQGDVDIVSNKARAATVPLVARVSTSLASADHYVQAILRIGTDGDSAFGVIARKAASSTLTFYLVDGHWGNETVRLFRCVAGSFTSLASTVAFTFGSATDYLMKLRVNGSTLDTWVDGVAKHVGVTDTNITGNLQCGIRGDSSQGVGANLDWNDWEAGDLAAAATLVKRLLMLGIGA